MGLVRDHVREEVYCREAMALGLDKDDTVIRRRLRQKMEFVSDDIAAQTEPTDADLTTYLLAHPDAFRVEQRFTFRQVYLNPERHGEHLARDAAQLLAQLNQAGNTIDPSALGDAFLLEEQFAAVPGSEVAKQFGESFAETLTGLQPGQWQGPVESGYGVHLVLVSKRTEGRLPELADVRDIVRREWDNARRLEANGKFYQELLKRYTVTIEARVGPRRRPAMKTVCEQERTEEAEKLSVRSVLCICFCLLLCLPRPHSHTRSVPLTSNCARPDRKRTTRFGRCRGSGENLRLGLYVELPAGCTNASEPQASMVNNAYTERWTLKCAGGLTGGTIHIAGLTATTTDVLARLERLDGTTQVTRLTPSTPSFVVEAALRRCRSPALPLLGVEHILVWH